MYKCAKKPIFFSRIQMGDLSMLAHHQFRVMFTLNRLQIVMEDFFMLCAIARTGTDDLTVGSGATVPEVMVPKGGTAISEGRHSPVLWDFED